MPHVFLCHWVMWLMSVMILFHMGSFWASQMAQGHHLQGLEVENSSGLRFFYFEYYQITSLIVQIHVALFIRQMSSGHVCAWCYRMFLSVFICIFPMLFCPNANMLNNSSSYHWHSVWQLAQIQNALIKRFIYVHTVH